MLLRNFENCQLYITNFSLNGPYETSFQSKIEFLIRNESATAKAIDGCHFAKKYTDALTFIQSFKKMLHKEQRLWG